MRKWTAEDIEKIQMIMQDTISLSAVILTGEGMGDKTTLDSLIASPEPTTDEILENETNDKILNDAIKKLSPREAKVIGLRFGLGDSEQKSLDYIGKLYGVTRERIRQIEAAALEKLRKNKTLKNNFKDHGW